MAKVITTKVEYDIDVDIITDRIEEFLLDEELNDDTYKTFGSLATEEFNKVCVEIARCWLERYNKEK